MNLREAAIAIGMALLMVGCSIACVAAPSSALDQSQMGAEIAILSIEGSTESYESLFRQYEDGIRVTDAVDSISGSKAVVFDSSWIDSNGVFTTNQIIADQLAKGKIIAGTDSSLFINEDSKLPVAGFSEDAEIYAMYYDQYNGRFVCCSINAGPSERSVEKFKDWVGSRDIVTNTKTIHQVTAKSDYAQWGTELLCESYNYFDDYGWLNINTSYFALDEDNADYNYYHTKYDIQAVPDDNRYTCDINVYSKLNNGHKILDYGPTTTKGSTTVGVDLGVNSDGVVSAGVSWSYQMSDVTIEDSTNYGTNEFSIKHDVNETCPVGSNSYTVKPGKVVRVDCNDFTKTGNYVGIDQYEVVFGKYVKSGIFGLSTKLEMKSFTERVGVIIMSNPHTLTIMPNGADGYIYEYEDPDYDYTQPETVTVSDGGHIKLNGTDLTKTGYEFMGYSTNKDAKVAQYEVGDVLTMRSDMTLYLVWVRS